MVQNTVCYPNAVPGDWRGRDWRSPTVDAGGGLPGGLESWLGSGVEDERTPTLGKQILASSLLDINN